MNTQIEMFNERWLPVPDFLRYEVSDLGRVQNVKTGKMLKPYKNKDGYPSVTLYRSSERKIRRVHLILLEASTGLKAKHPEMVCRHLDGDPANNQRENLAWGSVKENMADSIRHGTQGLGARNNRALLSDEQVKESRRLYLCGYTMRAISRRFGIGYTAIQNAVRGKTWGHIPGAIPIPTTDKGLP